MADSTLKGKIWFFILLCFLFIFVMLLNSYITNLSSDVKDVYNSNMNQLKAANTLLDDFKAKDPAGK